MSWKGRAAAVAAASVLAAAGAGTATASPAWAPAGSASIHPGVVVKIAGVKCIAGYIVKTRKHVFVTLPASCGSGAPGVQQNGCKSSQVPIGLPVTVQGAKHDAKLVYSSWVTMQLRGTVNKRKCNHNDLLLIQLDKRDVGRVNPSVPLVGGPDGLAQGKPAAPDTLTLYLEQAATTAQAVTTSAGGWNHTMIVPGAVPVTAVGSPVLTSSGNALGLVSVVPAQGGPGETGACDLYRELHAAHSVKGLRHAHLVHGTAGYKGP